MNFLRTMGNGETPTLAKLISGVALYLTQSVTEIDVYRDGPAVVVQPKISETFAQKHIL